MPSTSHGRLKTEARSPRGTLIGYAGRIVDEGAIGKDTPRYLRLVVEAEYPREDVQGELDGIDAALLLDITPETKMQLVDCKKRISVRADLAVDA